MNVLSKPDGFFRGRPYWNAPVIVGCRGCMFSDGNTASRGRTQDCRDFNSADSCTNSVIIDRESSEYRILEVTLALFGNNSLELKAAIKA